MVMSVDVLLESILSVEISFPDVISIKSNDPYEISERSYTWCLIDGYMRYP